MLNSGLVAIALGFERNEGSAFAIWRRIFPWLSINYFGGASVAALLFSTTYPRNVDFAALSIIVPLLGHLRPNLQDGSRQSGRRGESTVDQGQKGYLSTIETSATEIDAKDQVTHGHIRRVQRVCVGAREEELRVKD